MPKFEYTISDLLSPEWKSVTHYSEPEDIKRFLYIKHACDAWKANRESTNSEFKILDIGCGKGHVSIGLANSGYKVTAIDIDPSSIEAAKADYGDLVVFKCVSTTQVVHEWVNTFDVIICSEVLEHLDNPSNMILEIQCMLKQKGVFIATTPNGYGPRELSVTRPMQLLKLLGLSKILGFIKRALGYKGTTDQSLNPDLTHIQFFTKSALIRTIHNNSTLRLIDFSNANFIEKAFPFSLFYKQSAARKAKDCKKADSISNRLASGWNTTWIQE